MRSRLCWHGVASGRADKSLCCHSSRNSQKCALQGGVSQEHASLGMHCRSQVLGRLQESSERTGELGAKTQNCPPQASRSSEVTKPSQGISKARVQPTSTFLIHPTTSLNGNARSRLVCWCRLPGDRRGLCSTKAVGKASWKR